MNLIEEIKSKITCVQVAQRYGLDINHDGDRCKSPFRAEATNPTSFIVHNDYFLDFGDENIRGDAITLWATLSGIENGKAIQQMAEFLGLKTNPKFNIKFKKQRKLLEDATTIFYEYLTPEIVKYLIDRGIKEVTIERLKIGYANCDIAKELKAYGYSKEEIVESGVLTLYNRIIFPYYQGNEIVYLIGREYEQKTYAKYVKLKRNDYNENAIWGIDTLNREGEIQIVEGIIDAICVEQEGMPVITAVTGRFSKNQEQQLFNVLKGKRVNICMDFDKKTGAGQKFTEQLAQKLFNRNINTNVSFIKSETDKDLNDLYVENGNLDFLKDIKQKFEHYKIDKIGHDEDELEDFLKSIINKSDSELKKIELYITSKSNFDKQWITALFKTLNKAPSEDVIVKKLIEEHHLIYVPDLGWFEYNGEYWEPRHDTVIKNYIAELFGKHRTGNKVRSTYSLSEIECLFTGELNGDKNIINMKNGLLNVSNRKVVAHNKACMSTIQLHYEYDEKATCPNWNKHLAEILDNDKSRIDLMQEIFGYCLIKDTSLQKCFLFIGHGANGKSVVLNVLRDMVGSENCSNLEISDFNDQFLRIKMFGKMVNIASEMKADIKGTEDTFKKIVVGDSIHGCFKNKDYVDFKPFTKMVFAMNKMIIGSDISHGFIRRLMFVDFKNKFTDNPDPNNENEKEKILDIESLFELEMPGILNWALEGLDRIKKNQQFTETTETAQYVHKYVAIASPIQAFFEDMQQNLDDCTIERNKFYEDYNQWCFQTNARPMRRGRLFEEIRHNVFGVLVTDKRINNSRAFHFKYLKKFD